MTESEHVVFFLSQERPHGGCTLTYDQGHLIIKSLPFVGLLRLFRKGTDKAPLGWVAQIRSDSIRPVMQVVADLITKETKSESPVGITNINGNAYYFVKDLRGQAGQDAKAPKIRVRSNGVRIERSLSDFDPAGTETGLSGEFILFLRVRGSRLDPQSGLLLDCLVEDIDHRDVEERAPSPPMDFASTHGF